MKVGCRPKQTLMVAAVAATVTFASVAVVLSVLATTTSFAVDVAVTVTVFGGGATVVVMSVTSMPEQALEYRTEPKAFSLNSVSRNLAGFYSEPSRHERCDFIMN